MRAPPASRLQPRASSLAQPSAASRSRSHHRHPLTIPSSQPNHSLLVTITLTTTLTSASAPSRCPTHPHVPLPTLAFRSADPDLLLGPTRNQVNLPGEIVDRVTEALEACADEAGPHVLDEARGEIFRLMERDTYGRFRQDPSATNKLVEDFYKQAGGQLDGGISYASFRDWAYHNPAVVPALGDGTAGPLRPVSSSVAVRSGHLGSAVLLPPSLSPLSPSLSHPASHLSHRWPGGCLSRGLTAPSPGPRPRPQP